MEQITLNIENKSILPSLKKVLAAMDGVSIVRTVSPRGAKRRQTGLETALQEVREGKVSQVFHDADEACAYLGI